MNKQLLRALCKACITISYNLSMLRCCMIISGVWLHHLKDLIVCNCFFFLGNALFYSFCLVTKTSQEVVFAARSVQSCFTPNNFQGSHHVSPKVDLGVCLDTCYAMQASFHPWHWWNQRDVCSKPESAESFSPRKAGHLFLPECCI